MSIQLNSFSSSLMLGTTLYHNQPGLSNKLVTQVCYALIPVVAIVETAVALAFTSLSVIVYPFSSTPFHNSVKWLDSSAFTIGWSFANFFLNFCVLTLVADEKSARRIVASGNFMMMPHGAVI